MHECCLSGGTESKETDTHTECEWMNEWEGGRDREIISDKTQSKE